MRIGKAEPFRAEGGKAAPSSPGLFRAANPAGYIEASAIKSVARLILAALNFVAAGFRN